MFSDVRWLRYLRGPNEAESSYLPHNHTAVPRKLQFKGWCFSPFSVEAIHQRHGGLNIVNLCAVCQRRRGGACFSAFSCGGDAATLGFKVFLHQPQEHREASMACVRACVRASCVRGWLPLPFRDEDLGFALGSASVPLPLKWNKIVMRICVMRDERPFPIQMSLYNTRRSRSQISVRASRSLMSCLCLAQQRLLCRVSSCFERLALGEDVIGRWCRDRCHLSAF